MGAMFSLPFVCLSQSKPENRKWQKEVNNRIEKKAAIIIKTKYIKQIH